MPTFTERYYRDPAHLARAELAPERAWGLKTGIDWTAAGWVGALTPFVRREEDVIDWVKANVQDLWRTANIREVRTHGIEASATRSGRAAFARIEYTWLRSDAPSLTLLSKYLADYAPAFARGVGRIADSPGRSGWAAAPTARKRLTAGPIAASTPARATALGRFEFFVEATNLFDVKYQEIKGVDMAPRWVAAGLRVGR